MNENPKLAHAELALREQQPAGGDPGEVSDGYHTFNELYAHRHRLFSTLMHAFPERAWWSRVHHDGSDAFGGALCGIVTPAGPVTYHVSADEIPNLPPSREIERGKEWDGHKSGDVLLRLLTLRGLTAAGRGGEECPNCAAYRLCADVANRRADRMAKVAATPQQPPPVGVTDALRKCRDALMKFSARAFETPPWDDLTAALDAAQSALCPCDEATCVEPWEPGCGLGTSEQHARVALSHQQAAPSLVSDPRQWCVHDADMKCGLCDYAKAAPTAPEPAASGEGLLRFVRDFLVEYEEHEEDEWSQHWQELGERARGLIAANVLPPAVKRDALYELAAELEEFANAPLRILKIASNVRRLSGQGDVERLVEAAEGAEAFIGVMFGDTNGRMPATVRAPLGIPVKVGKVAAELTEALRPFQQQDTPEQEGR